MSSLDSIQKIAKNADQVEVRAFQMSYASIDEGLVDEAISGEAEDMIQIEGDPDETEEYAKQDMYNDNQQGKIMAEIQTRYELLGKLYPFVLKQSSLHYHEPSAGNNKIYETLLLISLMTNRQGKDWLDLVSSFEKLSAWVTKYYFQCSESWWTGSKGSNKFKDTIKEIHTKTKELEWNPDQNFRRSMNTVNDAGLDFINYRNLIDRRPGGLFFFGQCACGDNWFSKTQQDLRPSRLRRLFRQPYSNPVMILTIPYLISSDHEKILEAASYISGLVFDRARLTSLLSVMENDDDVMNEIANIYQLTIKNL